jgi:hypothetical protein
LYQEFADVLRMALNNLQHNPVLLTPVV